MKITKAQLKQIIKEELGGKLTEADIGDPEWEEWRDAHQMLISQLEGVVDWIERNQPDAQYTVEQVLGHIRKVLKDQQLPDPNKDVY